MLNSAESKLKTDLEGLGGILSESSGNSLENSPRLETFLRGLFLSLRSDELKEKNCFMFVRINVVLVAGIKGLSANKELDKIILNN